MKVIITWENGETTIMEEVVKVESPIAPKSTFLIQGRTSQDHINPQAVKSVKVIHGEEA